MISYGNGAIGYAVISVTSRDGNPLSSAATVTERDGNPRNGNGRRTLPSAATVTERHNPLPWLRR